MTLEVMTGERNAARHQRKRTATATEEPTNAHKVTAGRKRESETTAAGRKRGQAKLISERTN